jgi:hypothetical protein
VTPTESHFAPPTTEATPTPENEAITFEGTTFNPNLTDAPPIGTTLSAASAAAATVSPAAAIAAAIAQGQANNANLSTTISTVAGDLGMTAEQAFSIARAEGLVADRGDIAVTGRTGYGLLGTNFSPNVQAPDVEVDEGVPQGEPEGVPQGEPEGNPTTGEVSGNQGEAAGPTGGAAPGGNDGDGNDGADGSPGSDGADGGDGGDAGDSG